MRGESQEFNKMMRDENKKKFWYLRKKIVKNSGNNGKSEKKYKAIIMEKIRIKFKENKWKIKNKC